MFKKNTMKNQISLFEVRNERFPEPIDLTVLPANRGFWTDPEMFKATGATSLLPIKNLQRQGLLTASKYKDASKWHRAWTINDLVVISLTVDVATHAGLSILDAVDLLSLIPDDMHSALSIDRLVDEVVNVFTAHVDPHGGVGEAEDQTWKVIQLDTLSLLLVDRSDLVAKVKGAEGELRHIGQFREDGWNAVDADQVQSNIQIEKRLSVAESMLELNLSRMGLSPIRTQFQLEFDIEFVQPS